MDCGFDPPVSTVEHPLLAKGVMLEDKAGTYVLCAIDWGGLCNRAWDLVRNRIARTAGTVAERVAVQAVHQHTAPAVDLDAQTVLDRVEGAPIHADPAFLEQVIDRISEAVRDAIWRRASHVGTGWAPVDRVASNRRLIQPDGTILARLSSTTDPIQRAAPEGLVDGFVRTVSILDGETPVAQLHYYATHPQSYYRDGRVTYDVPGIARERLERETRAFQIYFNGCGGDIAMGKYNDGTPSCRATLADRLYDGMARSAEHVESDLITEMRWQVRPIELEPRRGPAFSEEACERMMCDADETATNRIMAAMILAFRARLAKGERFSLSSLKIGSVNILHLPGEPFVEYQLHAQRATSDGFVAVAGYGDCAMWYIPTDRAFDEVGGYETTWAFAEPCEGEMKRAIEDLVQD